MHPIDPQLLKGSCSEAQAQTVYCMLKASGEYLSFAQSFMHDADYQVARNALWTLTKATDAELLALLPISNELIDLALSADNPSVRRLSLNLIVRLPMREEDLRTDFLDFCLTRMISLDEYPGTQSLCMKLAYRMSAFYPELMDELMRTLRAMDIDYYKPAVRSVRSRIMKGKKVS